MKLKMIGLLMAAMFSTGAFAQDYGLTFGFHDANVTGKGGASTVSKFGFRLGGVVSVPLSDNVHFRSGLLYTQRHFGATNGATTPTIEMDYIDVPVLFQLNLTEEFGVFGGVNMAFNISHDIEDGGRASDTESLIPLLQLGINGTFQNEFGLEAYYERGVGDIYAGAKDYSVFGLNFIYWL